MVTRDLEGISSRQSRSSDRFAITAGSFYLQKPLPSWTKGISMENGGKQCPKSHNHAKVVVRRFKIPAQTKSLTIFSHVCIYFAINVSKTTKETIPKRHFVRCVQQVGHMIHFWKMRKLWSHFRIHLKALWIPIIRTVRRRRFWLYCKTYALIGWNLHKIRSKGRPVFFC